MGNRRDRFVNLGLNMTRQHGHLGTLARSRTRTATRIHFHAGADEGDAAGVELEETTTGLERDLRSRVQYDMLPRAVMNLATCFDKLRPADFLMAGSTDDQAVVAVDLLAPLAVYA